MGTLLKCNIDIETERPKEERQKDNKTEYDEQDSEDIQTTSNDLLGSKDDCLIRCYIHPYRRSCYLAGPVW